MPKSGTYAGRGGRSGAGREKENASRRKLRSSRRIRSILARERERGHGKSVIGSNSRITRFSGDRHRVMLGTKRCPRGMRRKLGAESKYVEQRTGAGRTSVDMQRVWGEVEGVRMISRKDRERTCTGGRDICKVRVPESLLFGHAPSEALSAALSVQTRRKKR